jgi:hypothetical protein
MAAIQQDDDILQAYGIDVHPPKTSKNINEVLMLINKTIPMETPDDFASVYLRMGGANDEIINKFIDIHHKKQRYYLKTMRDVMCSIANKFVISHNKVVPFPPKSSYHTTTTTTRITDEDDSPMVSTTNAIRASKTDTHLPSMDTSFGTCENMHESISYTSLVATYDDT